MSRKRECVLGVTFGCNLGDGRLWVSGGCRGIFHCGQWHPQLRCPYGVATNSTKHWCTCIRPRAAVVKAAPLALFKSIPMPSTAETSPLVNSFLCERFQHRWVAHVISTNLSGTRYLRARAILVEAGIDVRPVLVAPFLDGGSVRPDKTVTNGTRGLYRCCYPWPSGSALAGIM